MCFELTFGKNSNMNEGGVDDDSILAELPTRLRTEVSMKINGDIIQKVPFFKDCNPGFINSLVGLLKTGLILLIG